MLKFWWLARKSLISLEPVEFVLIPWRWRTLDTRFHKKKIMLNLATASVWNLLVKIKVVFRLVNIFYYLEDREQASVFEFYQLSNLFPIILYKMHWSKIWCLRNPFAFSNLLCFCTYSVQNFWTSGLEQKPHT